MARIRVDFPAPFGPMSASQPPPVTAQLTALTHRRPVKGDGHVDGGQVGHCCASPSGADVAGAAQHPDERGRADQAR